LPVIGEHISHYSQYGFWYEWSYLFDAKARYFNFAAKGKRWDVRLDFVRQFKTDYVRQLEGLGFEKKSLFIS
jgi:hypothetical protein